MNDRELLEKAAKAAGYKLDEYEDALTNEWGGFVVIGTIQLWNPLYSSEDAFNLMVDLNISTLFINDGILASTAYAYSRTAIGTISNVEVITSKATAMRRAIVECAAAMGANP